MGIPEDEKYTPKQMHEVRVANHKANVERVKEQSRVKGNDLVDVTIDGTISIFNSFVREVYEKYPNITLVTKGGITLADFDFYAETVRGAPSPDYEEFIRWTSELEGKYFAKYGINFLVEL